jgi:hypothetical protein
VLTPQETVEIFAVLHGSQGSRHRLSVTSSRAPRSRPHRSSDERVVGAEARRDGRERSRRADGRARGPHGTGATASGRCRPRADCVKTTEAGGRAWRGPGWGGEIPHRRVAGMVRTGWSKLSSVAQARAGPHPDREVTGDTHEILTRVWATSLATAALGWSLSIADNLVCATTATFWASARRHRCQRRGHPR